MLEDSILLPMHYFAIYAMQILLLLLLILNKLIDTNCFFNIAMVTSNFMQTWIHWAGMHWGLSCDQMQGLLLL